MRHLETLSIEFTFTSEDHHAFAATLRDMISADTQWEKLRGLTLRVVEAPRHQLVDLIRRHSSTLETIQLKDVRLIRSSWQVFIPQLREIAGKIPKLEDILVMAFVPGRGGG